MGWVYAFSKAGGLVFAATMKKFEMQNHGDLSSSLGKENLPKEYNGGLENEKVPDILAQAIPDKPIAVPHYGSLWLEKLKSKSAVGGDAVGTTRGTKVAGETVTSVAGEL